VVRVVQAMALSDILPQEICLVAAA